MKLSSKEYLLIGLGAAAFIGGGILLLRKPSSYTNNTTTEKNESSVVGTSENTTIVKPKQDLSSIIANGKTIETVGSNVNIRLKPSTDSLSITKITGVIGVVDSSILANDGYYWHKVKLSKPVGSMISTTPLVYYGYVRSDLVKEYKLTNYTGL